jgi:hypothetical protein
MKYCVEFYSQVDKISFACSEDRATLASDPSAVAGGRPMRAAAITAALSYHQAYISTSSGYPQSDKRMLSPLIKPKK